LNDDHSMTVWFGLDFQPRLETTKAGAALVTFAFEPRWNSPERRLSLSDRSMMQRAFCANTSAGGQGFETDSAPT
jgi:hypothetical protein